jgi:hypothetical protein
VVIGGDFNARLGTIVELEAEVAGHHTTGLRSKKGSDLMAWMTEAGITAISTHFRSKDENEVYPDNVTCNHWGQREPTQIDYILMRQNVATRCKRIWRIRTPNFNYCSNARNDGIRNATRAVKRCRFT